MAARLIRCARVVAASPTPPVLTAAVVREVKAGVVARLTFDQRLPAADANAGHRVCLTFKASRVCLHGLGARVARLRQGAWVLTGRAKAHRAGNEVTLRAPVSRLQLPAGRTVAWAATSDWDGASETLTGTLRTQRLPRRHIRILATGDSMIQVVDSFLADRLPAHRVIGEAHVSTGISKAGFFGLDWVKHAAAQAKRIHPDATIVWIGPNEGFPINGIDCCSRAWIKAYAQRARAMMRSYRRGGRASVYWLTLPIPRSGALARVLRAVNSAIAQAARGTGSGVHVIDMRKVFTPHNRFQQTACYRGRCFSARQPDGVHLSNAGARVAADIIARRLRADRAIR
jgi:lysophospholipase L1-like esterase